MFAPNAITNLILNNAFIKFIWYNIKYKLRLRCNNEKMCCYL